MTCRDAQADSTDLHAQLAPCYHSEPIARVWVRGMVNYAAAEWADGVLYGTTVRRYDGRVRLLAVTTDVRSTTRTISLLQPPSRSGGLRR